MKVISARPPPPARAGEVWKIGKSVRDAVASAVTKNLVPVVRDSNMCVLLFLYAKTGEKEGQFSLKCSKRDSPGVDQRYPHGVLANSKWTRVKAVFLAATDVAAAERPVFLRDACAGDEDLQGEVQSLLDSDERAASLCETPAAVLIGIDALAQAPPPPRLPIGTRLGTYEIIGFLAAGGMGEVYRARDTRLGREVAIKRVAGDVTDPRATSRLVTEARHASSLKHPSICTIHEVGETDGLPFIVMELIDGRSLSDIQREGTPPFDVALGYAIDVADALDHAHGRGIIHRDLKSSTS